MNNDIDYVEQLFWSSLLSIKHLFARKWWKTLFHPSIHPSFLPIFHPLHNHKLTFITPKDCGIIKQHIHPSIHPSIQLSALPSVRPSIHLSIKIYPSLRPSNGIHPYILLGGLPESCSIYILVMYGAHAHIDQELTGPCNWHINLSY